MCVGPFAAPPKPEVQKLPEPVKRAEIDPNVSAAKKRERQRAAIAQGLKSNIKTTPLGLTQTASLFTAGKGLLGA